MTHPAQVLPEYASKAFYKARDLARERTGLFNGLSAGEMPTLHETRALTSHLYVKAGYQVAAVQELMAHTDPDITRAYLKSHARKVFRVDMLLPFSVLEDEAGVRKERPVYLLNRPKDRQKILPENVLTKNPKAA